MKKAKGFGELLLGISHFFVDFLCTALLSFHSGHLEWERLVLLAIAYNGLAFAFQLPLGALGDLLDARRSFAALGCALVAVGCFFPTPGTMCLCIGIGNALFHVGGGREALQMGGGCAATVGRFVAPGAIGIFLGPRLTHIGWLRSYGLASILLVLAAVLLIASKDSFAPSVSRNVFSPLRLWCLAVCLFITVFLRSYMGTLLSYPFLTHPLGSLCFTLCIFLGKFLGGLFSDRFGPLSFSAAAQGLCVLFFTLSVRFPFLAFPGIFLFNTTMAITATELYRQAPALPGTMFGLTTFALFLGVLPRLLGWENVLFSWWGLGLLSLLSAASLLGGLRIGKGGIRHAHIPCAVAGSDSGD